MSEHPFGLCPECGGGPIIATIYRYHFAYCNEDRLVWAVGSNLFSHWREETVKEWQEAYDEIKHFEAVNSDGSRTGLPMVEAVTLEDLIPNEDPPELPF